jgi:ketosteroid isomerase-like protein
MAETEDLRALLNELRDIEAIKRLKARYCHLVDAGRWDELAECFTEDAVCDYGFFGRYEGRDQIVNKFFRELVSSASSFNAHMVHNPIIDVKGDTATGAWYLTAQTTIQPANQAVWVMGIYHDEFRRVAGQWKLSSLKFEFKYYTPYEDGWAKTRMWDPGA